MSVYGILGINETILKYIKKQILYILIMFALGNLVISKGKADMGSNMVTCNELHDLGRVVELFL